MIGVSVIWPDFGQFDPDKNSNNEEKTMSGWKTWAAAGAMCVLAIVDIANGDMASGMTKATAALGMVGIGHKIEKN